MAYADAGDLNISPSQVRDVLRYESPVDQAKRLAYYKRLQQNPAYPLLLLDDNLIRLLHGYARHADDAYLLAEYGLFLINTLQDDRGRGLGGIHDAVLMAGYVNGIAAFAAERGWTDELRTTADQMSDYARELNPAIMLEHIRIRDWRKDLKAARTVIDPASLSEE